MRDACVWIAARRAWIAAAVALPLYVAGCGNEAFKPEPVVDEDRLYWALDLNHRAVILTMAPPHNEVALVATPRNPRGDALATDSVPRFESNDESHVAVTPDGVVHAVAPLPRGTFATVYVRLAVGKVMNVDSVLVQVLEEATPFTMGSLSIQPIPPDTAKLAASAFGIGTTLSARIADPDGVPIPNDSAFVSYRVSDRTFATVDEVSGQMLGIAPGELKVYASATAFGVTRADTLDYRIGMPLFVYNVITIPNDIANDAMLLEQPTITIGVGGLVLWQGYNFLEVAFQGAFADPANVGAPDVNAPLLVRYPIYAAFLSAYCPAPNELMDCGSGNITVNAAGNAARIFSVPGTYVYTGPDGVGGQITGRVIVVDERDN